MSADPDDGDADPCGQYAPHVLRGYAFIGDGERGALIGPAGDLAWMCAPAWDSDAVFSTLIGGATLAPEQPPVPGRRTPSPAQAPSRATKGDPP